MPKLKLNTLITAFISIFCVLYSPFTIATPSLTRTTNNSYSHSQSNQLISSANRSTLITGKWEHNGGDAYPAELTINPDNSFSFKGWKDPKFSSFGQWSYDPSSNIIKLQFLDQRDYWEGMLTHPKEYLKNFTGLVSADYPHLSFEVLTDLESAMKSGHKNSDASGCSLVLNFYGFIFNKKIC